MPEIERSKRYRVNVSRTSTNKISWDCTVELVGYTEAETLVESDYLVAELNRRYPPVEEKKGEK